MMRDSPASEFYPFQTLTLFALGPDKCSEAACVGAFDRESGVSIAVHAISPSEPARANRHGTGGSRN